MPDERDHAREPDDQADEPAALARSAGSKRSASSAMKSGTPAIRIAASDEATCCSPRRDQRERDDDLGHRVGEQHLPSGRAASPAGPARHASAQQDHGAERHARPGEERAAARRRRPRA